MLKFEACRPSLLFFHIEQGCFPKPFVCVTRNYKNILLTKNIIQKAQHNLMHGLILRGVYCKIRKKESFSTVMSPFWVSPLRRQITSQQFKPPLLPRSFKVHTNFILLFIFFRGVSGRNGKMHQLTKNYILYTKTYP